MKVKTSAGFSCVIDDDALGDWEIVEKLVEVEQGKLQHLPAVMKDLIGEEGYLAAKDFVRTDKGRVPTAKMMDLFSEIMNEARTSADKKK